MPSVRNGSPPRLAEAELVVKLRSYQQEMLDHSLKQNVIVAMDTGSGKTHIAISRIAEELKYKATNNSSSNKIVWFMCPSVALCMQQYEVLERHLSGYLIKTLTGSDGVDKWTTQELWDGFLKNTKVVVCTPKVLEEALMHGFVKIDQISLLVFDEAHRCTKASPMNVIMQKFYHPTKQQGTRALPAILGLSASPVMSDKSTSLDTIETNLDAKAITPKVHRLDLEQYVHPPEVVRLPFQAPITDVLQGSSLCKALKSAVMDYDVSNDPWVKHCVSSGNIMQLQKQYLSPDPSTHCFKQLKALSQRASALTEQLGTSAAEWYIDHCIKKYIQREVYQSLILGDLEEQEREHLQQLLLQIQSDSSGTEIVTSTSSGVTDKLMELIELLERTDARDTRVIIFVEQRVVVCALAHILQTLEEVSSSWSVGTFVGTSTHAKRSTALADLAETNDQAQDLKDFRNGTKNLIISTSVLEEGIDIRACNVVVCFDLPKNLVSFIQRRGRARKRDSKYVLFISAQDHGAKPGKWEQLEEEMKQAYMNDTRVPDTAASSDESLLDREYRISSTGALLTTANAKAHLYHFCNVSSLSATRSIDPRPEFATMHHNSGTLWTASVKLPSFVHRSIRVASSSRSYSTEAAAIKDAAFEAYVQLHKENLLNDNLLPLRDDPEFDVIDQPSLIDIQEIRDPWVSFVENRQSLQWHAAKFNIKGSEDLLVSVTLWLPTSVRTAQSFNLYWNEHTTYRAEIERSDFMLLADSDQHLNDARCFTRVMLQNVHRSHVGDEDDFPVLFSPLMHPEALVDLLKDMARGTKQIVDRSGNICASLEGGLVRVRSEGGKPYFFSRINNHPGYESQLELTAFPKRKDWLHLIKEGDQKNAAYTAIRSFNASDCELDPLPVKYAVLAAFIPSIIHRLTVTLLAEDLRCGLLREVHIDELDLIVEAISSPTSGEDKDYNRLEFLGDSILKFCATLQVIAQHLNWPEGYLTKAKEVIVSNNVLTKAALDIGLDRYILTARFTGKKWRPPTITSILEESSTNSTQRQVSSKIVADVIESLVGAAYVDGSLNKAFDCIKTLLPKNEWYMHADAIHRVLTDVEDMPHLDLELLERLVGHTFNNRALLLEAVTHASSSSSTKVPSYERLEFLGDAVLDLLIVPRLFAHARRLKHWELHRVRQALSNSHFLGYCCLNYGIEEEISNVVFGASDARQEYPELEPSSRTVHLHDFMQADAKIIDPKRRSLEAFQKYDNTINQELNHGQDYPWADLAAMNPQKFFSDLVESILGALYLDASGDLSACEAFVDKLDIFKIMNRILDAHIETAKPKERLGILADRKGVQCLTSRDQEGGFGCAVQVDGEEVAVVEGCINAEEAETRAALKAVKVLEGERQGAGARKKRKLDIDIDIDIDVDMDVDGGVGVLDDD